MAFVALWITMFAQPPVPPDVAPDVPPPVPTIRELIACLIPQNASPELVRAMLGFATMGYGTSAAIYDSYPEGVCITYSHPLGDPNPPRLFGVAFRRPALQLTHAVLSRLRINDFLALAWSGRVKQMRAMPIDRILGGIE